MASIDCFCYMSMTLFLLYYTNSVVKGYYDSCNSFMHSGSLLFVILFFIYFCRSDSITLSTVERLIIT
jgi:uncharacterized membrane protein